MTHGEIDRKATFLRVYANLPQATREEIITVINNETYTWQSAKLEIEQETPIGIKILDILYDLEILK